MKALLPALCALLVLGSCKPRQHNLLVAMRDSTVVKMVSRDTLIYLPGDTVSLRVSVPCPDVTPVMRKQGRATVTAAVHSGQLVAACVCDTGAIRATLWDRWTTRTKERTNTVIQTEVKEVTPSWCWLLLAVIGAMGAWKLKRYIPY